MQKITRILFATALTLSILCFPTKAFAKAKIQIAILLDSSNSMDGLIDQTRTQLWQIVNSLTKVTKDGEVPELEVALYHYGNDNLPSEEGFVRLLTGFTPELDLVSEKLFSIQTNGGQEYAGWVIRSAVKELNWSKDKEDFRVIFIAGNESFDQGPIVWREAVDLAAKGNTLVNTIYCGLSEDRERQLWASGADLAQGSHFNINQDEKTEFIKSPYDEQIATWNDKLNQTYIPYGAEGEVGQQRQTIEDSNSGMNLAMRGNSKASAYYNNASWDLIDALDKRIVSLEKLPNNALPKAMQGMTLAKKQEYVSAKKAERETIQKTIRDLYQKRSEYVEKQRQVSASSSKNTLDSVIIQSLRKQLAAKGFKLQ
ncbi:vWA domain-containing protein [Coleofasciculus sp. FACHB-T130]|uniref:vWA domain-containing protein n=1 Tax=Cyanophyceae TaxID=3028117 RepID=UPI001689B072|nr:vWA domain-containing protein [Coleofasciculus sp. FACHB-T130]MBD1879009.1 VWA domain-containing protein [Coleofasciculus sp. FACHB-T130]